MSHAKCLIAGVLVGWAAATAAASERLTIGSKAPSIDIEHWLNDREPIREFEAGKVYVIEFWATWCGPCIASIPHLRELQQRHGKKMSVISVSDEQPAVIEEFLKRRSGEETFADITKEYWLTTDPDGSVKQDYMRAADQHGIPTAFIVGKTGEIEWIGHPMRIDDAVASVVAGEWDRQAFARQLAAQEEIRKQMQDVSSKVRQKKYDEAMQLLDSLVAKAPSPEMRQALESSRRRIAAESQADSGDAPAPEQRGQPSAVDIRRLAVGDQVTIPVTGVANGPVWGDFIYTTDSALGASAVHAGLVRVGETKNIKVWIIPAPGSFGDADRNGIRSMKWGRYPKAFVMQASGPTAASVEQAAVAVGGPGILGKPLGETMEMRVTGRRRGAVWGTDIYTADSDIGAAAVHAGVLKDGEEGTVVVAVVASPERHQGSTRNGVTSGPWGRFSRSIVIVRKSAPGPAPVGGRAGVPLRRPVAALAMGESMTVTIKGSDAGVIWGTDQYTGDSRIEVAAVHAGAVRAGEEADVVVTRVAALDRYQGSVKNGVRSQSWGRYDTAYKIAKKSPPDAK